MILNWFSPLPPMASGIGFHTLRILPHLARHADVRVYTDAPQCPDSYDERAVSEIHHGQFNEADFDVFNLGNNIEIHPTAWNLSLARTGLVVLHDLSYHHYFSMLFLEKLGRPDVYEALMQAYYGARGLDAAKARIEGSVTSNELALEFPLTALAASGACGMVSHNEDKRSAYEGVNRPLRILPLPYSSSSVSMDAINERRRDRKRRRVIMFGYMGENRRIRPVLRALSKVETRDRIQLDIYGVVPDMLRVPELISELDLDDCVKLHGFVEEDELDEALGSADLAVNLRNPSMGEASLSQLRIWDNALGSLVTNRNWYASLPEGSVFPVDPDEEQAQLIAHFERLVSTPEPYWEAGAVGRRILLDRHDPDHYAAELIDFIRELPVERASMALDPVKAALATNRFPWWTEKSDDEALASTRAILDTMVGHDEIAADA